MTKAAVNARIDSIALVCSGLGEGRDGIGDYCRCLAAVLADRGIRCNIMALSDSYAREIIDQPGNESHLPYSILRLPASMPRRERLRIARKRLIDWAPRWVSFHFVCYGFNAKGIVAPELFWLPPLFRSFRLAMMLHETWIGVDPDASSWHRLIGWMQRHAIRRLIKRLAPAALHTSNRYYQELFASIGIPTRILPLFGNIPVTDRQASWLPQAVHDATGRDSDARGDTWLFGIFGAIHPKWPARPLLHEISRLAQRHKKRAVVISIGNAAHGEAVLASAKRDFPEIDIVVLGHRQPAEISEFFNSIDFGITTHPRHMLGKSGTVAAMLEHGLPVICSWRVTSFDGGMGNPFIWSDMNRLEEHLVAAQPRIRRRNSCEGIASAYLHDLDEIDRAASPASP